MNAEKKELSHAEANAQGWYETICEHVAALECDRERLEELRDEREALQDEVDAIDKAADLDDDEQGHLDALKEWDEENAEELKELEAASKIDGEEVDEEQARERIEESPLSVEVRGDWHAPGAEEESPSEFCILLSTGGPALRLLGELDEHCQPTRAWLEHQDWGTPWTHYYIQDGADTLLKWASVFYFGD